jgi:hypothetical protein
MKAQQTQNTVQNYQINYLVLFFFLLFTLKVIGVLTWSWLWVTAPIWVPVAILVSVFGAIMLWQSLKYLVRATIK